MYDNSFKDEIDKEIETFKKEVVINEADVSNINIDKLNKFLKNTKPTVSSGEDKISNIMLKHISSNIKHVLVHLFKKTIETSTIPERWKKVNVKMIPKKTIDRTDPKNYRPISLTNCLARLCERFILEQINNHLKENNIIIKEQSGFRSKRQTKDNIFSICQRNIEAFNRKKKHMYNLFRYLKSI